MDFFFQHLSSDINTIPFHHSIQSTNWQSCRWKPPPPSHGKDHIGKG
ncbi:hypothetical protein EON65_17930, partial [archaeon]